MVESHESTRPRLEPSLPTFYEDHFAGKGFNSMSHYNLVHKFTPMPHVAKIPDATAAVEKEWNKLETISAWQVNKVKSKMEVIQEAQKDKMKVHFATFDGHLSSQEFGCHCTTTRL